jgi:hypothetical protein
MNTTEQETREQIPVVNTSFLLAYKKKLEKIKEDMGYADFQIDTNEQEDKFRSDLPEQDQILFDITRLRLTIENVITLESMFGLKEFDLWRSSL